MNSTSPHDRILSWLSASTGRKKLLKLALLPLGVTLVLIPSAFILAGGWDSNPSSGAAAEADQDASPPLSLAMGSVDTDVLERGLFRLALALVPTPTPTPTPTVTPPPTATPTATPPPPATAVPTPQPVAAPTDPPPPPPSDPPPPPPPAGCPTAGIYGHALSLYNAINSQRAQYGMGALAADGCVTYVAQIRSNDMAANGYFSHVGLDGSTAFTLMDQYGVPYGWAGENLARNNYPDSETVTVAITDLMASSGHRANILGANYTSMGVAVANDGAGMKYFTMIFTGPP